MSVMVDRYFQQSATNQGSPVPLTLSDPPPEPRLERDLGKTKKYPCRQRRAKFVLLFCRNSNLPLKHLPLGDYAPLPISLTSSLPQQHSVEYGGAKGTLWLPCCTCRRYGQKHCEPLPRPSPGPEEWALSVQDSGACQGER